MTGAPGRARKGADNDFVEDYAPAQLERRAIVGALSGGFPELYDLAPDEFTDWAARLGREALGQLREQGTEIDEVAVGKILRKLPQGAEAWKSLLLELTEWGTVTRREVLEVIEQVKEAARRRRGSVLGQLAQAHFADLNPEKRAAALRELQALLDPPRSEWPDPLPLDANTRLPEFPVSVLPPTMRDLARGLAEAFQVPPDLPALMGLAAVAVAAQGRFVVQARPGWQEPLNLYVAIVMGSGARKSPTTREIIKPLEKHERREKQARRDRVRELEMKIQIKEATLEAGKQANRRAGKNAPNANNLLQIAAEISTLQEQLELAKPTRLLFGGDCTPEKLGDHMAANQDRGAILDSEGSFFDHLTGLYSSTANIDLFLKAFDGDAVEVGRIKRDAALIERPTLTLGLAVQPSALEDLFSQKRLRGRGALARFVYAMPIDMLGTRRSDPAPLDPAIAEAYETALLWLLSQPASKSPTALHLTKEARASLVVFLEELEPRMLASADLYPVRDWAGKVAGLCVRLTGLFHLLDQAGAGRVAPAIGPEVFNRAAELARAYMIPHAIAAHEVMGARIETLARSRAQTAIRLLVEKGVDRFQARDLMTWSRRQFPTVADAQEALGLLVDHEWIRVLQPDSAREAERKRTGRPATSEVFLVHPRIGDHADRRSK